MDLSFPFELDDFQKEAQDCINNGKSVVVCAPTGAGKTVIAQIAVHKALELGKRVFYTTPLKALSNQKFRDFSNQYGEDKVGLLTGDISINKSGQIVVMTTEVFRNMLYGTNLGKIEENLKNVEYVVLDEVHYMNDEQRGTVWEESIIYCPNNIKIIALSATVANAQELTDWINSVHSKTELINTDFRPVPLKFFYFNEDERNIIPLFEPGGGMNKKIKPISKKNKFSQKKKKTSPIHLVLSLYEKGMLPAIYFTFSRKKCDMYMEECSTLELLTKEEAQELKQIINGFIEENPFLSNHKQLQYLYSGVASHHAGLLPSLKVLSEKLFQKGLIKVVFATETLAAGINMPARTTIISSISKRTDNGHRQLTGSEFLQMSGRAGRRGMDKVGNVVVIGNHFDDPADIYSIATKGAEALESRFTSSYSMVLNLLQRFNIDEVHELILKSFGYFSASTRLKPYFDELYVLSSRLDEINNFVCEKGGSVQAMIDYNKNKNLYVQYRKIANTLLKQAKYKGGKNAPEVIEYSEKCKNYQRQMSKSPCNYCKLYKKHIKELELKERFEQKSIKLEKQIEEEKDTYWNRFLKLKDILTEYNYLEGDYPTDNGLVVASFHAENELFLAELLFNGIFNSLSHSQLAAVVCAITTEDDRIYTHRNYRLSKEVKIALSKARDILKKVHKSQKNKNIECYMNLNAKYSGIIEQWINGCEWENLFADNDYSEGDVVRAFKRTVDVLRQLCVIQGIDEEISKNAGLAIDCINRDPIKED